MALPLKREVVASFVANMLMSRAKFQQTVDFLLMTEADQESTILAWAKANEAVLVAQRDEAASQVIDLDRQILEIQKL